MKASLVLIVALLATVPLRAQSPLPVVVPANTNASQPAAPAVVAPTASLANVVKELQAIRAANEETLRKQAATLEQLDDLQKTAEQIRIYASRS